MSVWYSNIAKIINLLCTGNTSFGSNQRATFDNRIATTDVRWAQRCEISATDEQEGGAEDTYGNTSTTLSRPGRCGQPEPLMEELTLSDSNPSHSEDCPRFQREVVDILSNSWPAYRLRDRLWDQYLTFRERLTLAESVRRVGRLVLEFGYRSSQTATILDRDDEDTREWVEGPQGRAFVSELERARWTQCSLLELDKLIFEQFGALARESTDRQALQLVCHATLSFVPGAGRNLDEILDADEGPVGDWAVEESNKLWKHVFGESTPLATVK